ncbi:sensor domain-containing diguanylate cyclase [Sporosalibacterium faouarense]|uniref:sensor domain-containing diguanylate cyclase n=1 Tax=Sporosalibacterium faouarense TaxID=516123 RepID=UPI00141D31B7|nr:sensor domain-containing diguanylate cyclase [Sporosalibacterium faouarense]MTI48560.1 sensor domain-containing diguanylate cyclase [Bacillota bacterium]
MKINRRNVYDTTLGILGLSFLLYLTFIRIENEQLNISLFIIFTFVGLLLQRAELRVSDFTLTFDIAIIIASYFILGLAPTLWLIGILFFLYRVVVKRLNKRVAFSNAGMLILIFILINFFYSKLGLQNAYSNIGVNGVIITVFSLLIFLLNWVFIFIHFFIAGEKLPQNWFESFKWDLYGNLIIIPMAVLLIEGYHYYNYIALIILSLLIVFANILFKLVRNLVFLNNELRVVHEASVSISSNLELNETTSSIINSINELVKSDFCSILKFDKERLIVETMDSKFYNSIQLDHQVVEKFIEDNLKVLIEHKKGFIETNTKIGKTVLNPQKLSKEINSVIFEPLIIQDELIGCLFICSTQSNMFFKEQLAVMDILANQAAIAIENARMYKETKNRAIKDSLTGLYNQSYFFDALESITEGCDYCKRERCTKCRLTSLVIFDIDFFKKVNDEYGHLTGDVILKQVTKIIKDNVRKSDIVSRYGGEEFTVILPRTDETTAFNIADRIRNIIEKTLFATIDEDLINITVSGGVSEFPRQADSGSTLLAYADRAMYIGSKRQGRNKISRYVS